MRHPALHLALLGLLTLSCEKPEPEPDAVPLSAELKAYALFQPGTHWVYQDSATRQFAGHPQSYLHQAPPPKILFGNKSFS